MMQGLDVQQQQALTRGDAVRISMVGQHVLIDLPEHIDLSATEALVTAAATIVGSGQTVMIDLDPQTHSDELAAQRPVADATSPSAGASCQNVTVVAPGFVRLAVRDGYWTVDLARGRLLRSQRAIPVHFLGDRNWERIRALWAGPLTLAALQADGTHLSARAAWTVDSIRAVV